MQITVTARHCEITEALQARARTVAERVAAAATRPLECTVLFDTDGLHHVAELRLRTAAGDALLARGEGPNHRSALDVAEDRLKRQLRSSNGRSRRARRGSPEAPEA